MAIETERKFLVSGTEYRHLAYEKSRITQGFLVSEPERVVRVRVRDGRATLTIKGPSSHGGAMRHEFEHPIPMDEARYLLTLCPLPPIEKVRHLVRSGRHVIEVDEFGGANHGLVLAEVELSDPAEPFEAPPFLAREVTSDPRYCNARLYSHPFTEWEAED